MPDQKPPSDPAREAAALAARAVELHQAGKFVEAEKLYRAALARDEGNATTHHNLGVLLHSFKRFEEAAHHATRAISLGPDDAEAHLNLALTLRQLGRLTEALDEARRSIALRPDHANAALAIGNLLQDLDQAEAAEAALRRALELNPKFVLALNNLGNLYLRRGAVDEAIRLYRQGIAAEPDHPEAHSSLSLALLLQGAFAEGFEEYEWRWHRGGLKPRRFKQPVWSADAPAGTTVLVYAEQGQGDTIQFARYVPLLTARGQRVVFEVQPTLTRLLAGIGGATVVSAGKPLPGFDRQIALLSLPRAFGTTLETIPGEVPYLKAPADVSVKWRSRFASEPAFKVGLVWRGRFTFPNDRRRSLDPALLAPLFDVPGVCLVSLQKEPRDGDLATLRALGPIDDIGGELGDFADTAGAIMALDLMISVDTAIAHLAGALARPIWVLLPFSSDWRWLLEREDSPWYPSARLFRQARPRDWPDVIARLAAALRTVAARGAPQATSLPRPDASG